MDTDLPNISRIDEKLSKHNITYKYEICISLINNLSHISKN